MIIYEFFIWLVDSAKYFINYKINNEKQIINSKKLLSLNSTSNAEFIDDYYDYIHNAMYEKENGKFKNKQIGILAEYGAGKSSIVKSCVKKDNLNNETIFVTLGEYEINTEYENIESFILKQIIFSEDALPNSRIRRINLKNNNRLKNICISILIVFLVVYFIFINKFLYLIEPYNINNFVILSILMIISLIVIIYSIFLDVSGSSKLSISAGGVTLVHEEVENNKTILNEYTDEIVNFFKSTNRRVVVFEDLDRIKKSEYLKRLLSELRTLNVIVNNSLKDKEVQFVYELGESIFDKSENLRKYFDLPIPLLPYSSYSTSYELLKSNLRDEDLDEYLYEVSSYLNGAREVYAVVNQYRIFCDNSYDKVKSLYLSLYKVLYPIRFNNLYIKKGILAYYLSTEFIEKVKKDYIISENKKIDDEIIRLKEKHKERVKPYIDRILDRIRIYGSDYNQIYSDNEYITSLEDIEKDYNNVYKLKDIDITILDSNGNKLAEDDIFESITKDDFFSKINNADFLNNINSLENSKIKDINYNDIDKGFVTDLLKTGIPVDSEYYIICKEYNEQNTLNGIEKVLIENQMIDMFTMDIISKRHNKDISNNDLDIMNKMYQRIKLDYNTKVLNCSYVLNRVNKRDFALDSFCIVDLYKEIYKQGKLDQYLNYTCDKVTEYKLRFFIELNKSIPDLFNYLKKYNNDIWSSVTTLRLSSDEYEFYIINTLKYIDKNNVPYHFKNCIENRNNILYLLEKYYEDIKNNLSSINNFKFSHIIDYNPINKNIIKYIYDNDMFEACIKVYEVFSKVLDFYFDKNKIVESVYANKDNSILMNYLNRDLGVLLLEIDSNTLQSSSEESIMYFINSEDYSLDTKKYLLKLQTNCIEEISNIDSKYYVELLNLNIIGKNWNNIYQLYKIDKSLSDVEIEYIVVNINELSKDNTSFDEFSGLAFELCNHDEVVIDDYSRLVDVVSDKKRIFNKIPSVSADKLDILIAHHLLKLKNKDDLRELLDNEEINNKNILLDDNYDLIKDDHEFFKDDSELLELLDTKIIPDIKCGYAIDCINTNNIYKTTELLSKIYDLVDLYNVRLNDNDLIINDLLSLDKNYDSKVRIFINNCDNEDFDISLALKNIGGDALVFIKRDIFITINSSNKKLLDKLIELKYILSYKKRKEKSKKYYIRYI